MISVRSTEPRPSSRLSITIAVIAALDLTLIVVLLLIDKVQVKAPEELAGVGLGMPLTWVTQDQGIDPPLPWRTRFLSPWENPTTVEWVPFVCNAVIIALLLAGAWFWLQKMRVRRKSHF